MSLRRARIKASASHLASLAGKRRVETAAETPSEIPPNEDKTKNDAIIEQKEGGSSAEENVPATTQAPPANAEKPRLKSRFRPNLSESDQQRGRLRRISGCEVSSPVTGLARIRTISGSSDHNQEAPVGSEAVCTPLRTRQISENNDDTPMLSPNPNPVISPGPPAPLPPPPPASISIPNRTRKLTEPSSAIAEKVNNTVFDQRKVEHKKKFNDGIPERTKLTMFDLIYYNPSDGNRMSNPSSLRSSRAPSVDADNLNSRRESEDAQVVPNRLNAVADRLAEEAVDDPDAIGQKNSENDEDEENNAMPVPQVKVAADGSIILDEASTLIETTASKKAKEDLLKVPIVFENANQATNYGSWGKKRKNADWSDKATVKFYKALSVFGTDFSLMEGVFKKRTRHELKMKFKKEEKNNRGLIDKCLSQGQTFDPSIFDSEDENEEDSEAENVKKKKEKKAKPATAKKRRHRVKGNRGRYYADSDDADESELASETEQSMMSSANNIIRRTRAQKRQNSRENSAPISPAPQAQPPVVPVAKKSKPSAPETGSLLKSILTKSTTSTNKPGFALPPALLAANPNLANAAPGSLVVVASPASPQISSPNAQLLEVFIANNEDNEADKADKTAGLPKRTRTISENHLDTTSIGRVRTHSGTFQS